MKLSDWPKISHFLFAFYLAATMDSLPQVSLARSTLPAGLNSRKIPPTDPIASTSQGNRADTLQKHICQKIESKHKRWFQIQQEWMLEEYFYSHLDWQFFHDDNMKDLIQKLYSTPKISLKQFSTIQMLCPQPKLFSAGFVDSERNKLKQYRKDKMGNGQQANKKVQI